MIKQVQSINVDQVDTALKLDEEFFYFEGKDTTPEYVEKQIFKICKFLDPKGTNYKVFDQFLALKGLRLWPDDWNLQDGNTGHDLINSVLLIAEASQLNAEISHPIRQFILSRELLNVTLSDNLVSDYGELGSNLIKLADKYLDKISLTVKERMKELSDLSKFNPLSFNKKDFLEACLFPLALPATFQLAFNSFFGHEIFVNQFELEDNKIIGVADDEWGNLSSEPASLINFIGTLPYKPDGRIIDWGCGSGASLFILDKITSMELSGFDKNPAVIHLANQNARLLNNQNISFYTDDIFDAPIEDADIIYFFAPLRKEVAIKKFFESFKKRAENKNITIWSNDIIRFTRELDAQSWLKKTHKAGGITEYKSL